MSCPSHSPNADSSGLPFTPYTEGGGEPLSLPLLNQTLEADVVIIGAGVAGLSTALHAQNLGLSAVVLEAKEVGWGASSRNSGHIPAATRQEPSTILKVFGEEQGRRIIALSREAPDVVYGLAETHGMQVDAVRTGGLQAAHNAAALNKLETRAKTLAQLGHEIRVLGEAEIAAMAGTAPGFYKGGILDPKGGTLNPLAYVRGLARAALAAGAQVFEHSMVRGLERQGAGWVARTLSGRVQARYAIVATNGYSADLLPQLWRSIIAVRAYQFMTEPLPEELRALTLPGRQGFTDTRRLMSGIRIHRDGRLHFSGLGPLFGPERAPDIEASMARIHEIFPQIQNVRFDYWWSGWMAMNRETTWKIHEVEPNLLALLGCNGRGIGLATMYGRELAQYMAGKPRAELALPFSAISSIPMHPLRAPLVNMLVKSYGVRDRLETRFAGGDQAHPELRAGKEGR